MESVDGAPAAGEVEQPLARHHLHRLADGDAADAVMDGEFGLARQARPRHHRAEDHPHQLIGDARGGRAGFLALLLRRIAHLAPANL